MSVVLQGVLLSVLFMAASLGALVRSADLIHRVTTDIQTLRGQARHASTQAEWDNAVAQIDAHRVAGREDYVKWTAAEAQLYWERARSTASREGPDAARLYWTKAEGLFEAIIETERARGWNSHPAWLHGAYFYLGWIYVDEGRFAEAQPLLVQALAIDPDDAGTHYELGLAQRHQYLDQLEAGRAPSKELVHKSDEHFMRALQLYNGGADPPMRLSEAHYFLGLKYYLAGEDAVAAALLNNWLQEVRRLVSRGAYVSPEYENYIDRANQLLTELTGLAPTLLPYSSGGDAGGTA